MEIKTIASSSKGCCYIVDYGKQQIIIEAGISIKRLRKALNFNLSGVICCLVSHIHADHSKYSNDFENAGMRICAQNDVISHFQLSRGIIADRGLLPKSRLGMKIYPIKFDHDVPNVGFLISDAASKTELLYVTDTDSVAGRYFPDITHLMIEANHSFESLIDSERDKSLVERISRNHLDIDSAVIFAADHKKTLEEVHLIHLSDYHSDSDKFKKLMAGAVGVPVYVSEE